ncbi:MAG TPA: SpoIIE family protein phosphatase [Actinomycetota bacterium]|nr:SpoIIE family protein phosphatase [Actinomycetota bacterium]
MHRLAGLLAILDTIEQSVVYSDHSGVVRVVNRAAAHLLDLVPESYIGAPRVQLLREVARRTEDPEGFMELFQQLLEDPDMELHAELEQILPARRTLRLFSGAVRDARGSARGRVDVFTDITESVRRAEDNKRLYEQARRTAESYQRGLLPSAPPHLPRMNIVAHYLPVAGDRAIAGDFYDFLSLPDGRMGIVFGDVCGIGPAAANDAALARYTVTSYFPEESEPGALLERVAQRVGAQLAPDRFIRLVYAILDPERGRLAYANAGHVPPMVHRAKSGEVEWLEEGGVALGLDNAEKYKSGHVELEPSDLVVFYSDGVSTAPRLGQPYGTRRLVELLRDWGAGSPGEFVQAVVRAVEAWVSPSGLRDDIAVVACQVVPDHAMGEPVRELVLPNEPARLKDVRAFVASFLADLRAPVEPSSELLMAVGEAAANCACHGRRVEGRSEVRVKCRASGDSVSVTLADDGVGFDPRSQRPTPDPFAAGGRGLYLMVELTDDVEVESSAAGTTITLTKTLR